MFPEDSRLLAIGKYSVLGRLRHEQLKRVQGICTSIVTASQAALRDCEEMPPVSAGPLATLENCLDNLQDARERIVKLAEQMVALKPIAWPSEQVVSERT